MWHFNDASHGWLFLNGIHPVYNWLSDIVLALGYGACIVAVLFGPASLKRPFESRVLRWIGLISYSLYIWHLPLLIFLSQHLPTHLPGMNRYTIYAINWIWVLVVIVPVAVLSYLLTERPWMQLGDDLRRKIEKRHHHQANTTREVVAQLTPIHAANSATASVATQSSAVQGEGSVSR
jgi:peptidoglycan/LPS O-acetylase OafA/YrhL